MKRRKFIKSIAAFTALIIIPGINYLIPKKKESTSIGNGSNDFAVETICTEEKILIVGVGGGGINAVNYMHDKGIRGVDFIVANTDVQSLERSPVQNKIQLGKKLTKGLSANNISKIGEKAAIENIGDLKEILSEETKMVFIVAGMGGGTGTGGAPVIAKAAKNMGILTVGIVTIPFRYEGKKRIQNAIKGINKMEKHVDTLLVINNEKIRDIYGNLGGREAFRKADQALSIIAKSIAELISTDSQLNLDFAEQSFI